LTWSRHLRLLSLISPSNTSGRSPLARLQLWTDANGNLGTLIRDFSVNVPANSPHHFPN
jgi:hypothetical protein